MGSWIVMLDRIPEGGAASGAEVRRRVGISQIKNPDKVQGTLGRGTVGTVGRGNDIHGALDVSEYVDEHTVTNNLGYGREVCAEFFSGNAFSLSLSLSLSLSCVWYVCACAVSLPSQFLA